MHTQAITVNRQTGLNVAAIDALHRGTLFHVLRTKNIREDELEDAYQDLMVVACENAHSYDPSKGADELTRVARSNMKTMLDKRLNRGRAATARREREEHEISECVLAVTKDEEKEASLFEVDFAGVMEDALGDPLMSTQLTRYVEALYKALTPTEQLVLDHMGLDILQGRVEGEDIAQCAKAHGWKAITARMHVSHIIGKARTLWIEHFDLDLGTDADQRLPVDYYAN